MFRMSWYHWLNGKSKGSRRRQGHRTGARFRRLEVERLETRTLLSTWASEIITIGSGDSASFAQQSEPGHDSYLYGVHSHYTVDDPGMATTISVALTSTSTDTYDPSARGSIASLDIGFDIKNFDTHAVQVGALLRQGDNIYVAAVATFHIPSWQHEVLNSLSASSFTLIRGTQARPDFRRAPFSFGLFTSSTDVPEYHSTGHWEVDPDVRPPHRYWVIDSEWWTPRTVAYGIDNFSVNVHPAQNDAVFVSQSVPSSMTAGQAYTVSVTMENVGTNTWTAATSYRLGTGPDGGNWGVSRVELAESVPHGSQATFQFTITAPARPGTYNFQWRLVQEGVEWFGDTTPNVPIIVSSANGATFVSQSVPSSMTAGLAYTVAVTMKNAGISTWTAASSYRLGSQNPQDTLIWGPGRIALPTSVAPGSQVTFEFTVTAPTKPGTYNFQWRLVQEGVEWFGDTTPNVPATVNSAAAASFVINAPGSVLVGTNFSVTVTAKDTYGNTATGYNGTVSLTSSNGQSLPSASVTLTNGAGTATLYANHSGTAALTAVAGSIRGTSGSITIIPTLYNWTFYCTVYYYDAQGQYLSANTGNFVVTAPTFAQATSPVVFSLSQWLDEHGIHWDYIQPVLVSYAPAN
jgi:uncharacterized protein affecting Mg2+/Co2+ transport